MGGRTDENRNMLIEVVPEFSWQDRVGLAVEFLVGVLFRVLSMCWMSVDVLFRVSMCWSSVDVLFKYWGSGFS